MQHQGSAGKLCLVLLAVLAHGVSDALRHDKVLHSFSSATQVDRETPLAAQTKREAPPGSRTPPKGAAEQPLPAWAVAEPDSLVAAFFVMLLLTILIAVMVWWSSRGRDTSPYVVVEPVGAVGLCRAQKGLAILSVLATASLAAAALPPLGAGILSTVGLVADSGVAATLLLRLLLCFVDGEHNLALRAHFGGVNRSTKLSTFWFDVRSNSGTVQAAVVLVAFFFALLLFALVSVSGLPIATTGSSFRTQWHGLLSYLLLLPGALLRAPADMPEPRAAVPQLALVLNAAASAGVQVGAPTAVCLLFAGMLMFGEAATAGRVQSEYAACADVGAFIEASALDDLAFEDFLYAERRLGVLFCYQQLRRVDLAWRQEEREELWSGWIERFARSGAPFQVVDLPAAVLENSSGYGSCCTGEQQQGMEAARSRLLGDLAAAYARAALNSPIRKKSLDDVSTEAGADESDDGYDDVIEDIPLRRVSADASSPASAEPDTAAFMALVEETRRMMEEITTTPRQAAACEHEDGRDV
jgi:hypothetical protein